MQIDRGIGTAIASASSGDKEVYVKQNSGIDRNWKQSSQKKDYIIIQEQEKQPKEKKHVKRRINCEPEFWEFKFQC